jgi:hypothetical protein
MVAVRLMSVLAKVIVGFVAVFVASLLIGSIAFTVLSHDSDNGDIHPPPPVVQTVP